jgi:hypothetical protein
MGARGAGVEAAPSTMVDLRQSQSAQTCAARHMPAVCWHPAHPQQSGHGACSDLARLPRLLMAPRRPPLA